jgi:hypothetical protein
MNRVEADGADEKEKWYLYALISIVPSDGHRRRAVRDFSRIDDVFAVRPCLE